MSYSILQTYEALSWVWIQCNNVVNQDISISYDMILDWSSASHLRDMNVDVFNQ